MSITELFAVLPYLKTSGPVDVRGIRFRGSKDLDGLPDRTKEHLTSLFSLFFLRADHRISEMVYARLDFTAGAEGFDDALTRLRQAHALIGYLYSSPQNVTGRAALDLEHSSLYLFNVASVSNTLLWPGEGVVEVTGRPPLSFEEQHGWVEGYAGLRDWRSHLWVSKDSRIFPPHPNFSLNLSQDLAHDFGSLSRLKHYWALQEIIEGTGGDANPLEGRLFTAVEWHNRSYAGGVAEDLELIYLAIAFECLLNLDQGPGLSERFKESVITLLGPVPRLDSWLEQFYKARSGVVHDGHWPHLKFFAVEKDDRLGKIYKGKESAVIYRSLASYGRRVFRACLTAILSGAQLAHQTQLSSLFVHNQERLERMCAKLGQTGMSPGERIRSVRGDVLHLNNSWFEGEHLVRGEAVLGVAKRLARAYLDTVPTIPEEALELLRGAAKTAPDSTYDQFERYMDFHRLIRDWRGNVPRAGLESSDDPLDIILSFIGYMVTHRMINRERKVEK
jgi:hypothetical protein